MLCGIALKEGYIKSLSDPVTDYIPELQKEDPLFDSLKIEHLLDMTAFKNGTSVYGQRCDESCQEREVLS